MPTVNDISRKTLRHINVRKESANTVVVEGEFGVNTFQIVILERRQIEQFIPAVGKDAVISEAEKQYRAVYWEMQKYWKAQEGKTYSQLQTTIETKTGNTEPEFVKIF